MVEDNKLESYATLPQGERRGVVRKIHRFVEYDDRLKSFKLKVLIGEG